MGNSDGGMEMMLEMISLKYNDTIESIQKSL